MIAFLSFLILVIFIFSLFVLVSLARSLSILLIFQRTSFWFHWFFSINFLLYGSLISVLMLIISSFLLAVSLICWGFFFLFGSLLIYKWRHWFETFLIQAFDAINFCLRGSPQILINCILIFIQFKIVSTFPFYFSLTQELFRNVLFSYQSAWEFSGDLSVIDF